MTHDLDASSPPASRNLGRRLGVAVLSLVVSLVLANEWLVRYWPVGGCVLQLDDEVLFKPVPNAAHVQFMSPSMTGTNVVVRMNRQGMLGPEPSSQRTKPRWMVFGDSFVMAENEPYERTFAARLQQHLDEQIEVLCAGVTGYGPDQTWLRMRNLVPEFRPDGVILVLCSYNDFGDPIRNNLMYLDAEGGLQRRHATVVASEREWFELRLKRSHRLGWIRLWETREEISSWPSPVRPSATVFADYLRAHREDFERHRSGDTEAHSLLRDVYDADVALHPDWKSSDYKVRLFGAILTQIRDLCASAGIPLVAVIAPNGVDLDPESWMRLDPMRYPTYERNRLCSTMFQVLEGAEITSLNLFELFEQQATQKDLFVGPVDPHWNALGMDLGAGATAEFLKAQGLVQAP